MEKVNPCKECPFRRQSVPGWLGCNPNGEVAKAEEYIHIAHSDTTLPCHLNPQTDCKGLRIYRRHVHKIPRDPAAAALVVNTQTDTAEVFCTPAEFISHHRYREAKCIEPS